MQFLRGALFVGLAASVHSVSTGTSPIYSVLDMAAWRNATHTGWYDGGAEAKASGGQIHCCTGAQATFVLENYFPNMSNVTIAFIDVESVHAPAKVVWVSTVPGMAPFPHIEGGPLAVAAVTKTVVLTKGVDPWSNATVCQDIDCTHL